MQINSSAAYASAINLSQGRSQFQTEQIKQSSQQDTQVASLLGTSGGGSKPSATGGRGQIVDITA